MQLIIEIKDGRFPDQKVPLEDGRYIISMRPLNLKSTRDYQKEYFALVDAARDVTGNSRYSIHEEFKEERNVESTKNFDIEDWVSFIEGFKWYYFNKADILL